MSVQKPSVPKGTRDFSPGEIIKRNYIFDTIRSVYKKYGYVPIETPAMENLDTLLGKYGEEGDKLLFKILDSGDFLKSLNKEDLNNNNINKISLQICEKGLRYDLTVPFARYVVQNRNEITFPFKRYQIQPVWRADRPQKGRYREFYQCDADVIGSDSLLNEVELLLIINEVFKRLGINITVKLNNRKILAGLAEYVGYPEKIIDITVAIDKLEKIGKENVVAELTEKGISNEAIEKLMPIFGLQGVNVKKLEQLQKLLSDTTTGLKGIEEMNTILKYLSEADPSINPELDLSLARGLSYYTGAIIEVKANDIQIGSICGGGRYDDLTGIFGMPGVSGVGISFGADRIYDVMSQLNLFPDEVASSTKILFVNFGEKEMLYCLGIVRKLREKGISAEIFPEAAKLKKQIGYADSKNIPFVALVGENEMRENKITLKDMKTGSQNSYLPEELFPILDN